MAGKINDYISVNTCEKSPSTWCLCYSALYKSINSLIIEAPCQVMVKHRVLLANVDVVIMGLSQVHPISHSLWFPFLIKEKSYKRKIDFSILLLGINGIRNLCLSDVDQKKKKKMMDGVWNKGRLRGDNYDVLMVSLCASWSVLSIRNINSTLRITKFGAYP